MYRNPFNGTFTCCHYFSIIWKCGFLPSWSKRFFLIKAFSFCFRGTYWANYATGLGASMHELGHCFDLAHTPKGIMGRGFDDMNCVWTMWRKPSSLEKDLIAESVKPG